MTLFRYMYVCYLQMAPGRLTRSRGEASIPVVRSTVQSTETPPEANPPAQSSSTEAQTTDALASTTGNYIEHTLLQLHYVFTIEIILHLT